MTQWLTHHGEVRHRKLYDELRAVENSRELSLSPAVEEDGGSYVTVGFRDSTDPSVILAVLAAHDPTTPGPVEAAEIRDATNEQTLRQRADQAVANLETAWENWPTLTQAQKDAALRLTVRVTVALARLQLRKLDNA